MRTLTVALTTLLLAWTAQTLAALGSPSPQLLAERLAPIISPYWSVTGVTITASVNTGDAVEPNFKQRFEATVKPSSTLYVKNAGAAEAFAPYVPIVPTVSAEATRTLYGIAQSTYSAGQWSTKFELENSVASLGMPRSMFSTPTVVRGSKEEARIQDMLRPDVAQRVQRKLQA